MMLVNPMPPTATPAGTRRPPQRLRAGRRPSAARGAPL